MLGFLFGVDYGLRERHNAGLGARGARPSFWERHLLLPLVVGTLATGRPSVGPASWRPCRTHCRCWSRGASLSCGRSDDRNE